jgi:hypothetical protein
LPLANYTLDDKGQVVITVVTMPKTPKIYPQPVFTSEEDEDAITNFHGRGDHHSHHHHMNAHQNQNHCSNNYHHAHHNPQPNYRDRSYQPGSHPHTQSRIPPSETAAPISALNTTQKNHNHYHYHHQPKLSITSDTSYGITNRYEQHHSSSSPTSAKKNRSSKSGAAKNSNDKNSSKNKRHWLFLTFPDKLQEKEFADYLVGHDRYLTMVSMGAVSTESKLTDIFLQVASVGLLLLSVVMIIVIIRSINLTDLSALIAWVVPQAIFFVIHLSALLSAYFESSTALNISTLWCLFHAIAFAPIWTGAWNPTTGVGPSVYLVIIQSMCYMSHAASLTAFVIGTAVGITSLIIGVLFLTQPPETIVGRGYQMGWLWASAVVQYSLVTFSGVIYARMRQRGLRRLFLMNKRKEGILKVLDDNGLLAADDKTASSGTLYQNTGIAGSTIITPPATASGDYSRKMGGGFGSGGGGKSRPQTAKSVSNSIREDWDGPIASRPGTAAHFRGISVGGNGGGYSNGGNGGGGAGHYGSTYGGFGGGGFSNMFNNPVHSSRIMFTTEIRDKSYPSRHPHASIMIRPNCIPRRVFEPEPVDEDTWYIFSLFLGQTPWPPANERRYLRSQARLNGAQIKYTFLTLFGANILTSVFDHLDRVRLEGDTTDAGTLVGRLLMQLLPSALIPLTATIVAFVFEYHYLLLLFQPLIFISYSALTASYLLAPMELLSSISPDSFPQSKMTAYLVTTTILAAQTGIITSRNFIAWSFSVLFLSVAHIPLVITWGGTFDSRMPWSMGIQVFLLLVALVALVRGFDAKSREAYVVMNAVRIGTKAIAVATAEGLITSEEDGGRTNSNGHDNTMALDSGGECDPRTAGLGRLKLERVNEGAPDSEYNNFNGGDADEDQRINYQEYNNSSSFSNDNRRQMQPTTENAMIIYNSTKGREREESIHQMSASSLFKFYAEEQQQQLDKDHRNRASAGVGIGYSIEKMVSEIMPESAISSPSKTPGLGKLQALLDQCDQWIMEINGEGSSKDAIQQQGMCHFSYQFGNAN